MPDLSFLPESELRKEAFDNPVAFGRENKQRISGLLDIADLNLLPFDQARGGIEEALSSVDPWKKYWGLIVCSSFGKEAADFYTIALILTKDENLLVRTRAAEFLAVIGTEDPKEVITGVLRETNDHVEATLVLNTVVLLMDGPYKYEFDISRDQFLPEVLEDQNVKRRLEYILQ